MEVRAVRDKSAGRVEDFPGPVVSRDAAVAFATRAGGARETDERAGVAREAEEIADNSEENAAVAFATRAGEGGVADKSRRSSRS